MDHRRAQGTLAGVIVRRHVSAVQEHEQMLAMRAVTLQQVGADATGDAPRQQAVEATLQAGALTREASGGQDLTSMPQMNCGAEHLLHLVGPRQARALVNHPLQGAQLMAQTELMLVGGRVQLRFPSSIV